MKKRIWITAFMCTACLFTACSSTSHKEISLPAETTKAENTKAENTEVVTTEAVTEAASQTASTEQTSTKASVPQTESSEPVSAVTTTNVFSFSNLKDREFYFSSGVGGWYTFLFIEADGSFSGMYQDNDMGSTGDGYPNGTVYQCEFYGKFTQPVYVDDFCYKTSIASISYKQQAGTEKIIDNTKHVYTDVYGLEDAKDIMIYLPGKPVNELPEEYIGWVYPALRGIDDAQPETLRFYGLYNVEQREGFSCPNTFDEWKERLRLAEIKEKQLEKEAQMGLMSQQEMNQNAFETFDVWDKELNYMWNLLKTTLDEETMKALTKEERAWIKEKEAAAKEAGKEWEGGSMQPLVEVSEEKELTKARVYELYNRYFCENN